MKVHANNYYHKKHSIMLRIVPTKTISLIYQKQKSNSGGEI